jgi:hypothetical protein
VDELPRRVLLHRVLQFAAALAIVPRVVGTARAADSCVDPSSESLRASLHYASVSPKADETCSGCGFFSREGSKPACGSCQIMSGPVDEKGHCDSWAAKS